MTEQFILFLLLFLFWLNCCNSTSSEVCKTGFEYNPEVLVLQEISPQRKSFFYLIFVVKREPQTLPWSGCIMQPLPEHNLEMVAAGVLKTGVLLFY